MRLAISIGTLSLLAASGGSAEAFVGACASMRRSISTALRDVDVGARSDMLLDDAGVSRGGRESDAVDSTIALQQQADVVPDVSDAEYFSQSRRAFVGGVASASLLCGCTLCAAGNNGRQKFFARMMNNGMADYESLPQVRQFKMKLFDNIRAGEDVMEIGIGSAPNVKYYSDRQIGKLWALEPNREFDDYIIQSVAATDLPTKVDIVPGFAEQIPKPDDSVDVVIGTMVMCSVQSVSQSLAEIHRILKPNGRYIFTEHVAAPDTRPFLTMAQQLADPLQQLAAEGCHLTRNPEKDILHTFGEANVRTERFVLSGENNGVAPHFLLSPHLIGVATKAA